MWTCQLKFVYILALYEHECFPISFCQRPVQNPWLVWVSNIVERSQLIHIALSTNKVIFRRPFPRHLVYRTAAFSDTWCPFDRLWAQRERSHLNSLLSFCLPDTRCRALSALTCLDKGQRRGISAFSSRQVHPGLRHTRQRNNQLRAIGKIPSEDRNSSVPRCDSPYSNVFVVTHQKI